MEPTKIDDKFAQFLQPPQLDEITRKKIQKLTKENDKPRNSPK
jgi:hypothetical protein